MKKFLLSFLIFSAQVYSLQENKFVIIIPSFNNKIWLQRNLDSVVCQHYENFEVIYIDDCSTDKTPNLVEQYIEERKLDIKPDLVYIDASHEEIDVYNDIKAWFPKLSRNGMLCGDDWNWESVRKGVTKYCNENNITVKNDDTFWWFEL